MLKGGQQRSEPDSEVTLFTPDPNAAFMPQPLHRQNVLSTHLTSQSLSAFYTYSSIITCADSGNSVHAEEHTRRSEYYTTQQGNCTI